MEIKYIDFGTTQYYESLKLRDVVLRIPWNRSIDEDDLTLEDGHDILIGGFIENNLEGVIVLHPINSSKIQIKYLAVYEESRGLGIGRELVLESEEYGKKNGYREIFLESRDNAVNFYEKLDYALAGDFFMPEFVSIPHIPMIKKI